MTETKHSSSAEALPDLEPLARQLYEASRKRVSGRPAWERLNQNDPYDMGMRSMAFEKAAEAQRVLDVVTANRLPPSEA